MKILVVYPDQLFPNTMASHDRVIEMVRCLARTHEVHVACLVPSDEARRLHETAIRELGAVPVLLRQPFRSLVGRKLAGFAFLLASLLTDIERHYFYVWNPLIALPLIRHLRRGGYDAVQVEFCYQATLFRHVRPGTLKVIDTIDVLYEKREKEARHRHGDTLTWQARRRLAVFRRMELVRTALADVIVSISAHDLEVFRAHFPDHEHLLMPMGRLLTPVVVPDPSGPPPAILFYGHMGSEQNQAGFWRFWNRIHPLVVQQMGLARPPVLVVGSSPPDAIRALHDGTNVIVTGFVQDVRPWLARAGVLCVPLDLARNLFFS